MGAKLWLDSPKEMADDEPTFESTESGASHTYPQQAGEIRKGSFLMIKGNPCKCCEVSTSKTGKHGHAKAHIVAIDIFTGKKMEDLCPTSHNLDVPFVKKTEYQVLSADADSGEVSLLQEDGSTKDDDKNVLMKSSPRWTRARRVFLSSFSLHVAERRSLGPNWFENGRLESPSSADT